MKLLYVSVNTNGKNEDKYLEKIEKRINERLGSLTDMKVLVLPTDSCGTNVEIFNLY